MYNIGDRVDYLSEDLRFVIDSGTVTKVTPESEDEYANLEVTLDDGKKVFLNDNKFELARLRYETESADEGLLDFIRRIESNWKRYAFVAFVFLAIIGGAYVYMKGHHATPKVQEALEIKPKSQIQIWTDEMAKLENEKAEHYERQKYLRKEDKAEVERVKKIDAKINKLKDKIHLYITPAENE